MHEPLLHVQHKRWVLWLQKLERFLLLQFIHVLRLADENIARYHSYFIGHSQNGLSACLASLCLCTCTRGREEGGGGRLSVCGSEFPMTEALRPSRLPLFLLSVFLLSVCQGHMTAAWPHWWQMNHGVGLLNNNNVLNVKEKKKHKENCWEEEEWKSNRGARDVKIKHTHIIISPACVSFCGEVRFSSSDSLDVWQGPHKVNLSLILIDPWLLILKGTLSVSDASNFNL